MASADKMINDMGGRCIAAGAAEPFAACEASDNTGWIMNAAVAKVTGSARWLCRRL